MKRFNPGDTVRKTKGSQWQGVVVGTYSTDLTPEGYAVESSTEKGSVQIYPAAALELVDGVSKGVDSINEPVKTLYVEVKRSEVEQMRATIERQEAEIEQIKENAADAIDDLHRELAALKAHPRSAVVLPEPDEIMQMAFEEGQPAEDASGYYFDLEEFDLFVQRLLDEVARLNPPGECVAVPRDLLEKYMHESFPQENNGDKWFLLASQLRAILAQQGKAVGDE
jgi:hypothetical protein